MASIRLFLFFILCGCVQILCAQQGNPFEIQERLDSVYNKDASGVDTWENTMETTSEINVFDVRHSEQFDRKRIEEQAIPDSTDEPSEVQGSEPIGAEEKVSTKNPFDVSHVPVRRSKLKDESIARKPKVNPLDGNQSNSSSNVFLFWYVLFSAVLIAIVVNTQKDTIPKIYKSISNENILKLSQREDGGGMSGHYLLLYGSFFINAAVFIYLLIELYFKHGGFKIWFFCLLFVVGIYFFRHLALFLLGSFFPIQKETKLYSFTIEVYNIFLGLILIPLNLIIAFGPLNLTKPLIYTTIGLILLIFLIRYLRGIFIASKYIESNFLHFFIYLCTFEIAPLLVVLRMVKNFG